MRALQVMMAALVLLLSGGEALAQSQSLYQAAREGWDLSVFSRFNGPSLRGDLASSYNPFVQDRWPLQLFQSLTLAKRPSFDWSFGLELGMAVNLNSEVKNRFGNTIAAGSSVFHPLLFAKRFSALENDWAYLDAQVGVFLPTSQFAQTQTQILSLPLDFKVGFKVPKPWSLSVIGRFQPTFYQQALPPESWMLKKQVFYVAIGYTVSRNLDDQWEVVQSAQWDAQHLADAERPYLRLQVATDPRMEWKINRYFLKRDLRVGVSLQHLLPLPSLESTTLNAEISYDIF